MHNIHEQLHQLQIKCHHCHKNEQEELTEEWCIFALMNLLLTPHEYVLLIVHDSSQHPFFSIVFFFPLVNGGIFISAINIPTCSWQANPQSASITSPVI